MGNTQIEVSLDTESVEEDFKKDFYAWRVEWCGYTHEEAHEEEIQYPNPYPLQYNGLYWDSMVENGEQWYSIPECFTQESLCFNNVSRWKMLNAIKKPEQDVVLITEYFKGPYSHLYSWGIESDKFDFTKLCFHYAPSLSEWSLSEWPWGTKHVLVAVTYDGKLPDDWHIEPPIENKGWNMLIVDGSGIEKLLANEETGSE
jgi:hypothetical protein